MDEFMELNKFYISAEKNPELYHFVEDKIKKEMTFTKEQTKRKDLPKIHLGIIPDGNRRWCKQNKKNCFEFSEMIKHIILRLYHECATKKIPELFTMVNEISIYVLSKDNLNRKDETLYLIEETLDLLCTMMKLNENAKHISIDVQGDISCLPIKIQQQIKMCVDLSSGTFPIHLAIGYNPVTDSELFLKEGFQSRRQIDMVIRSGGQLRSSGFYPLQTLYSEWFYFDTLWPDMNISIFHDALEQFLYRQRNFGK